MAVSAEDAGRLLIRMEVSQARMEKQMAAVAARAAKAAVDIEGRFQKANDNIAKSFTRGASQSERALRANNGQISNLSFQLNDISQQLAMGVSPFTVMVQQGSQVAQIMQGSGGLISSFKMVGGAFAAMLNPVSIATLAIIGLTGVLVEYIRSAKTEVPTVDDMLKRHAEVIASIKGAYGEAAGGMREYTAQSREVLQAQLEISRLDLSAKLRELAVMFVDTSGVIQTQTTAIEEQIAKIGQALVVETDPAAAQALYDQLDGLYGQLQNAGTGALEAADRFTPFRAAINDLITSIQSGEPDFVAFYDAISRIANEPGATEEIKRLADEARQLAADAEQVQRTLSAAGDAMSTIGGIASGQVAGVQALTSALQTLSGIAVPALNNSQRAKAAYEAGLKNITSPDQLAALDAEYMAAMQREENRQAGARAPIPTARPNIEMEALPRSSGGGGRGSRSSAISEAQREAEAVAQLISNLQFERSLIGLTEVEREKAIALRRAEKGATAEQRAEISMLIEATHAERQAMEAANRSMEEMRDIAKDVLSGFISDLREGKSASEALSNALEKVANKLLDMALNNLFAGGGIGGGRKGGLLGGAIIPGILHKGGVAGKDGYGHGRAVSPSVFAGAKRYHKGGIAGLQPGEVPAILQRGEVVIPRGGARAGGMETINVVLRDDSGRMAEIADQRIQTSAGTIVQVSVAQSQRAVRQAMPQMIAETQTRKM